MSDYVVVDASVAVKWLVAELNSEEALALVTSWAGTGVTPVAPYLMPAEVSNALHKRVVSDELSVAAASDLMETLLASGIEPVRNASSPHASPRARQPARPA